MSPTALTWLILVGGTIAVIVATLVDRHNALAAARAMREAAGLPPSELPEPDYVDESDLAAAPAARMSADDERTLEAELADAAYFALPLADRGFATHTGQRAILRDARVLVCSDDVASTRELLAILKDASTVGYPLLIAAPSMDLSVQRTLAANLMAGTLHVTVVIGAPVAELATATGTQPVSLAARQSGSLSPSDLGTAALAVADPEGLSVVEG